MDHYHCDTFILEQRSCWSWALPSMPETEALPLVCILLEAERMVEILPLAIQAIEAGQCRPFRLIGFESLNWNSDFSPWPAPPLFAKGGPFDGKAPETLAWMEDILLPHIAAHYPVITEPRQHSLLGYSLGGLFALWALYESSAFGSCACCSGSLWYPGWLDYMSTHPLASERRVYLSLGRGEEKSRNPIMATVGDATRRAADLLAVNSAVRESTLQWHDGGHFHEKSQRIAQALIWLMATDIHESKASSLNVKI